MFFRSLGQSSQNSGTLSQLKTEKNVVDNISGYFDPTALERGAKALKELDASPNAQKAFDLVRLQEVTKQMEIEKEMEQSTMHRTQAHNEKVRIEAEERRKTISHQQEEERVTAQYKARLEAEAYQKKLHDQQEQNASWLKQQHEQFLLQEKVRKENEQEILLLRQRQLEEEKKLEKENIKIKIREKTRGKIQLERENLDIHLQELKLRAEENRKTRIESIQSIFGNLSTMTGKLYEDKMKLATLVSGVTLIALGVYGSRSTAQVIAGYLESCLGKPSLVRETSRNKFFYLGNLVAKQTSFLKLLTSFMRKSGTSAICEDIILPKDLQERLGWTVNSLINSRKNNIPFRHMLLWGAPGTGKTLFARTLALKCGMDYAIMTGGDVGPLGKDAANELNKLFKWAKRSRHGLILFIDEAEAFLRKGRESTDSISENMRNVLSSFLYHTGTESKDLCILLATNAPECLDRAILDRVDESFEFSLPKHSERAMMINMFLNRNFPQNSVRSKRHNIRLDPAIDAIFVDYLASRTEGFSGRQLSKLIIGMQAAALGSGSNILTKGLAEAVLVWKLAYKDELKTNFGSNIYTSDGVMDTHKKSVIQYNHNYPKEETGRLALNIGTPTDSSSKNDDEVQISRATA
ncbi:ATPase, AAA family protein [Cryptosporidium serpentis]